MSEIGTKGGLHVALRLPAAPNMLQVKQDSYYTYAWLWDFVCLFSKRRLQAGKYLYPALTRRHSTREASPGVEA